VFPYVENHNFYIEHWSMSVLVAQAPRARRDPGQGGVLASTPSPTTSSCSSATRSTSPLRLYKAWAVGTEPRGPYWPRELAEAPGIYDALADLDAPKALGKPPEVVTEPFTIMLWGITDDSIGNWLGADEARPATCRHGGLARGRRGPGPRGDSAEDIGEVQDGEILVAPITAPSWAPVFTTIQACVTDIGGIMSHAAIVCREYGCRR
jgi:pyruvate, water dikinase